jgi:hypothetical protein
VGPVGRCGERQQQNESRRNTRATVIFRIRIARKFCALHKCWAVHLMITHRIQPFIIGMRWAIVEARDYRVFPIVLSTVLGLNLWRAWNTMRGLR